MYNLAMNYPILHKCGHPPTQRTLAFTRPESITRRVCGYCFYAPANKLAEEESKRRGYVTLDGTARQIAWANKIRLQKIGEVTETFQRIMQHLQNEPESAWWIDRKDYNFVELCGSVKNARE